MALPLAALGQADYATPYTYNNTIRKGQCEQTPAIDSSGSGYGFNGVQIGFNRMGSPGQWAVVEASEDLQSWRPLWTNSFVTGSLSFTDPQAGACLRRYCRTTAP